MALDIAGGVFARLAADATLCALLGADGGAPAIFTGEMPTTYEVAVAPSVVIDEPVRDDDEDDLTERRREVALRVRLFSKPIDGDNGALREASERVKSLFRNVTATNFSTGKLEAARVSGPVSAPTDDPSLEGRLLFLTLSIKE